MAQELVVNGNTPVKIRNPLGVLGLGLITFGIYLIFHFYYVNREMVSYGQGLVPGNPGTSTLFLFIPILNLIEIHKTFKRVDQVQQMAGMHARISIGLAWVLALFTGLHMLYVQSQLNSVWNLSQMQGGAGTAQVPHQMAAN